MRTLACVVAVCFTLPSLAAPPSPQQLAQWLKRFPAADTNQDGKLSVEEAEAFRRKMQRGGKSKSPQRGIVRQFAVNPGWEKKQFPDYAICNLAPAEIKRANGGVAVSFPKPPNGVKRIVGTGHSFMAPGYKTLPLICREAGFEQPLHLHTGGGMTGSARYKWEQENGIFQFDKRPKPKLLAAIANGEWEAMVWGPYYQDRPAYYECWIDFCLKHNPDMAFYLSDAWPQVEQLGKTPDSEAVLTTETFRRLGRDKRKIHADIVESLNKKYPHKVFVLPTCDAMVLAVEHYHRGELPGVEGINRAIGKKNYSIWRDRLGHLGPGFERLEGYVFYATLYGRSPEQLPKAAPNPLPDSFPSQQLDEVFRKIAWQAVTHHPLSGVRDANADGLADPMP